MKKNITNKEMKLNITPMTLASIITYGLNTNTVSQVLAKNENKVPYTNWDKALTEKHVLSYEDKKNIILVDYIENSIEDASFYLLRIRFMKCDWFFEFSMPGEVSNYNLKLCKKDAIEAAKRFAMMMGINFEIEYTIIDRTFNK